MLQFLLSQVLIAVCVFAIPQTCIFESGIAEDYVPCNQNASQGTCCYQGEACLDSGLCYGSLGVYRGACINEWSSDGCVTYCDDKSDNWANLYPCTDGTGSAGPNYWWCGNNTDVTCSKTSGTTLSITPGVAFKILGNAASSSTSSSAAPSSTSSSTSTSTLTPTGSSAQGSTSCATTEKCNASNGNVTAVGAGVGASLGALSLAMLLLYFNERRRRKNIERSAFGAQHAGVPDHYATEIKTTSSPPYEQPPQELESNRLNELGPRY